MSVKDQPRLESADGTIIKIDPQYLPLVIGRATECQVTVNDHAISRRHAQINESEGRWYLEDLGSRNGTNLNHSRIRERTPIRSGDTIQICDATFVFKEAHSDSSSNGQSSIMFEDRESGLSSIMSQMNVSSASSIGRVDGDRRLETLMQITRELNRSLRLAETLQRVMDYLFQLFPNADRGVIVLANQQGEPEPLATKVRPTVPDAEIRVSKSILKYVMGNRQSVLSHDVVADERIDTGHSLATLPIRSVMSVPLLDSDDNAIGMIQLDTAHRQQAFDQKDLELLTNVSIQSGMAIENSRLVEQMLETKLMTQELETARGVQESLLPKEVPNIPGYRFHHFYRPMNQIGGDYFDYLRLDDDRLAIIVGDVVGHGVPAALLMAKLSSECRMALQSRESLSTLTKRLNESFAQLPADKFATLILTILDHRNHRLEVMNGGHLPPFIRHANGQVEEHFPVGNFAIGLLSDEDMGGEIEFESFEIEIQPGDFVLLHTDGLNESMNEEGAEYTRERVVQQISCKTCHDPRNAVDRLITDVGDHLGTVSQHDDICVLGFRRD